MAELDRHIIIFISSSDFVKNRASRASEGVKESFWEVS